MGRRSTKHSVLVDCSHHEDEDKIPALKQASSSSSSSTAATVFSSSTSMEVNGGTSMEVNGGTSMEVNGGTISAAAPIRRRSSPRDLLEIFFSKDDMPTIETLLSFSPRSSDDAADSLPQQQLHEGKEFSSAALPPTTPVPTPSKEDFSSYEDMESFLQRFRETEDHNQIQFLLEYSYASMDDGTSSPVAREEEEESISSVYSEMLPLTFEVVEDHINAENEERRDLIQQELDDIMDHCHKKGHFLEDEAIEALGIAANQVAFLHSSPAKPSIAFTILQGSLLQVAAKHYYGDANSFLVQYAPQLRAAVRQMKSNPIQEEKYYSGNDYEYVRRDPAGNDEDIECARGIIEQAERTTISEPSRTRRLVDLATTLAWGSWKTAGWVYQKMSVLAPKD
eukprot:scaffold12638_cov69-Cylindrotheca_fusiformis.AAC.2